MDIFISNLNPKTNHAELRLFLRDTLNRCDILAFEIFKKIGHDWAILTVAVASNGHKFLSNHGGQNPMAPLVFKKGRLWMKVSNRKPDPLKVKSLLEKEATMRAKLAKKDVSAVSVTQSSNQPFPFHSFQTGIWHYDFSNTLAFDPKYLDLRQGTITCGKRELVVYLAATLDHGHRWHCRIDIPYSIVEHIIPSQDNRRRATVTLTLRTPPKIYKIVNTDDLHLYSGDDLVPPTLESTLDKLNLRGKRKSLERVCKMSDDLDKNSALCMVYNFTLPSVDSATQMWVRVSRLSALSQEQRWRIITPSRMTESIEMQYNRFDHALSSNQYSETLTFAVRFQLLALVLEGSLAPEFASKLLPPIRQICDIFGPEVTAAAIRRLDYQIPTPGPETDPDDLRLSSVIQQIVVNAEHKKGLAGTNSDLDVKRKQHSHLISTYKATITPTGMLLRGPDMNVSNRILRKYAQYNEYFMRVFFADEDGLSVLHDPGASQDRVYARFHQVLAEGITITGRKYSFLGFSNSSLRNYTAWFMAPFYHEGKWMNSEEVIKDLGDFEHIHCSAKCAARIGQAFTDTLFSIPLGPDAVVIEDEPDVERNGHCFSDGCGTISSELLEQVWRTLPRERRRIKPTILQIRCRGAKGVLSLDARLPGKQLRMRKSMTKYTAKDTWRDLEICGAAYKPLRLFLNHQFIKILEDLGISPSSFMAIQKDALRELELVIKHPVNAASFLEYSHSGVAAKIPVLFNLMHAIGIDFQSDRFLTDIVEVAAMSNLRDMKYRARIPIEKGYLLYGIMDETNELKENEVYIATGADDENGKWKRRILLSKRAVVTRAPALHPGDIQIVQAVNVSEGSPLRQLHNCIVFSQQGPRDLPSKLGGGDLDGDLFHIIFDQRLIPPTTYHPSEYPPTQAQDLGRPANVGDIVDFFVEYMNSDRLGQISNKHKIRADIHPEGTLHNDCILLAKLASDAVDFSKSGKPVDMREAPRGSDRNRPDFMAPGSNFVINNAGKAEIEEDDDDDIDNPDSIDVLNPDKSSIRYYKSSKVLGFLYRNINETSFFDRMHKDFESAQWGSESLIQKLDRYIDRETRVFQWEQHRGFAEELRQAYCDNMYEIMETLRPHRGKPLTELEVFSGNILGKKNRASSRSTREANLEVRERFDRDVSAYVRRIVSGDGDNDDEAEALPRAIACFKISLEEKGWDEYFGLKSWKYVAAAVCLEQLWKYMNFRLRPL
ncbi:rna-dependent rna polymeras-like protein [Periconia macrospinosa]|uniref:RNA-dependent RNA polymerase n=1 Tax=Periconia macrospinosa TaxID=97972 RepID=A0A2V1DZI7_9PLEO|nr:rna-dependent rna polymeras-like protein [Periconia macrospinosa]